MQTSPLRFHTRFNPSKTDGFKTVGPSKTDPSFLEDSDINELVRRFKRTGSLYDPATMLNRDPAQPSFGDFSNIPELLDAANQIVEAGRMFDQLPAMVREFFGHDSLKLLQFVELARKDENLYAKGVELGILKPKEKSSKTISKPAPAGGATAVSGDPAKPDNVEGN